MFTNTQPLSARHALVCLAALAASAFAITATAGQPKVITQSKITVVPTAADNVPTVRVQYDDLDLSTDRGTELLYRRISMAAKMVCPNGDSRDLEQVARNQQCRADAIARAVQSVNNPQLALVHASHMRHG